MILHLSEDKNNAIFHPEDPYERKALAAFPGLLREGLVFFCPNKAHIIHNLYCRLKRKVKTIKYIPELADAVQGNLKILDLPADFKFHTEPLIHQRVALRFAYTFGNFLNLCEPGLGKTKVTLDYIWLKQFNKTLIVCPKALLGVWVTEAAKHRPELSVYVIESTDWATERMHASSADVIVVNYDKAVSLEKPLASIGFDFIAVDEGLIKNPSTERTKAITRLGKSIPYRCVMSGTLVNNSPIDIFAPVRFIEPCLTGEAFGKFRDEYVVASQRNRFVVIGYKNVSEIKDMLSTCGIIMTKAEWLKSLPAKEFNRIHVQMGDMQRDYYQKLASNYLVMLEEVGVELEVDNPLAVMIKLNQISNGFVYYRESKAEGLESIDDMFGVFDKKDDKKPKQPQETYFLPEQPKADALVELISSAKFNDRPDSIGEGTRAIIWFNLSAELDIISKALSEKGVSFSVIKGGDKKLTQKIAEFNTDPSIRFLVCQAKTLNYGVTVLGDSETEWGTGPLPEFDPVVSDEIFYSLNFSLEMFLQQQDRIHRIGQKRLCRYWMLLSNSKVERTIADRLESKQACSREVLVDIIGSLDVEDLLC